MSMFDKWFPPKVHRPILTDGSIWKPHHDDVQTLEVIPENPQQYIYPVLNDFRKGMWVKTPQGRNGILYKYLERGLVEVHLTDASGFTLSAEEQPLSELIRLKSSEIPTDRIKHLSRNELRALGYED